MPRLIFKCPYIKGKSKRASAHLKNMVNYIATRDGAERIDPGNKNLPATEKQKELIEQLAREFPLSRGLFEYQDFVQTPTQGNASEFITRALEDNLNQIAKRENYLEYIAKRPRAIRMGAHGLFNGSENSIVLSQVAEEIAQHPGNVWLPIISLRREDAERLGYDNAENWRSLLPSNAMEIAKAMKIPWEDFRWYAAFHDEGNHPHVHMVCYSADPSNGFLTSKGIENIKSMLAKQIFRQELTEIYSHQTKRRDELTRSAGEVLRQLAAQMQDGTLDNERIEQLMKHLSEQLKTTSGKKKYGYLKAPLKSVVDEIVDELCKDPRVAEAYDLWYALREDVLKTYKDTMPERVPLSRQKEFKRIKNIVIEEAVRMGADPQHTSANAQSSGTQMRPPASIYQSATRLLHHMGNIFRDQQPPGDGALRVSVDSKLRQKIREKKMALGHKADDHENTINM